MSQAFTVLLPTIDIQRINLKEMKVYWDLSEYSLSQKEYIYKSRLHFIESLDKEYYTQLTSCSLKGYSILKLQGEIYLNENYSNEFLSFLEDLNSICDAFILIFNIHNDRIDSIFEFETMNECMTVLSQSKNWDTLSGFMMRKGTVE